MPNDGAARRCKIEVDIYGDQYLLSAGENPEYVRCLAMEIDGRMSDIAAANPQLGPMRISILMLLGLVADLEKTRDAIKKQEESLAMRCIEIERDIEQLLGVA